MELIFEVLFQFLGEILLQFFFEILAELGLRSLKDSVVGRRNPILSIIGFTIWGAIAGGISLWLMPASLISDPRLRTLNLFVTPVVIGGLMMLIGKIRYRRGQDLGSLDRFGYAFTFAFAMAFVRDIWAV
ncbi:hypothetical protein [Sphingomonas crocodyli]|uniref:Uncharacterized protein n=1 Tax=Sphingomonas crocodyli TaxID=1979270 RepID=A0A437M9D2_9SPHN|nr:hypothetical protein [Sphingomonas crocodyli]RVT94249.1 hypothetical protein EOD43_10480 [Sphingomonas crocodyli]